MFTVIFIMAIICMIVGVLYLLTVICADGSLADFLNAVINISVAICLFVAVAQGEALQARVIELEKQNYATKAVIEALNQQTEKQ